MSINLTSKEFDGLYFRHYCLWPKKAAEQNRSLHFSCSLIFSRCRSVTETITNQESFIKTWPDKKLSEDNWPNCQVPKISSNQVDPVLNSMSYFEELSHGNLSNKVRLPSMTTFWDLTPKPYQKCCWSNPLTLLSPCWGPWKCPKALVLQVTYCYWSENVASRCPGSSLRQIQVQNFNQFSELMFLTSLNEGSDSWRVWI